MENSVQNAIHDSAPNGPVVGSKNRRTTNLRFLIIFVIFCTIWLTLGCYASICNEHSEVSCPLRKKQSKITTVVNRFDYFKGSNASLNIQELFMDYEEEIQNLWNRINIKAGFTLLSVLLSVAYIFLVRIRIAELFLVVTISPFIGFLYISYPKLKETFSSLQGEEGVKNLHFLIPHFCTSLVLLIISLSRNKIKEMYRFVEFACSYAAFFPLHLLIVLVELLMKFILTDVFITTIVSLPSVTSNSTFLSLLNIYNFIAYFWIWNFLSGVKKMILSGTFSTWYWTNDKKLRVKGASRSFLTMTVRYHLGTVAYGSLVTPICEFFYELLRIGTSIQKQVHFILKKTPLKADLSSLEKFTGYMSTYAYVMTAIYGSDFSTSGKTGFNLILRNAKKISVSPKLTKSVYWFRALFILPIPFVLTVQMCSGVCGSETLGITIFVLIHSIISTLVIFDVIDTAVDTIFINALIDYESNDGSVNKPYFMSKRLKKIIFSTKISEKLPICESAPSSVQPEALPCTRV